MYKSQAYTCKHNNWMYTYFFSLQKHYFEVDTVKIILHIIMYFITQPLAVYNKYTNLRNTTQPK